MRFYIIKTTQIFSLLLALGLLSVNIIGIFKENDTLEKIKGIKEHKIDLNFENRTDATSFLKKFEFNGLEEKEVKKLNKVFAESIVHFWPRYNYFSIYENWIIYFLQRAERLLELKKPVFGGHERISWEKVLESGFGLCSQASIALYDYLVENKQEAKIIGLHGHVVVELRLDKKNFIMDPDYNVVFAGTFEDLSKITDKIRRAYSASGYSDELVKKIVEKYESDKNNSSKNLWQYYPKYFLFYYSMELLKWLLPSVIIIYNAFQVRKEYLREV